MFSFSPLTAISPIDGRYHKQTEVLANYFSEYALMKYRLHIEVEYLIWLSTLSICSLNQQQQQSLREIVLSFSEKDALHIKQIEATTNHDVKAIEYFLKEKLTLLSLHESKEWVHFGLTSQDINNTSVPLSWKSYIEEQYVPQILKIIQQQLAPLAHTYIKFPMLARTHGQAATPTTLGKELFVFIDRLYPQLRALQHIPHCAKFGGATGNFNAHVVAFPHINWIEKANAFVWLQLHLKRLQHTTQIEHYDAFAAQLDALKRINTIWIDFCRDMWMYISMDYFKQKIKKDEVGSSAMPHKVNPIDFENAEGNLGIANALCEHLSAKLPISRLQRDLTDSTVLRNIGVLMGHIAIAFHSLAKGIDKLVVNEDAIHNDLSKHWIVLAEAIQTILRREHYPSPYEALKDLTRGKSSITKEELHAFIRQLNVSESVKEELLAITPFNYVGMQASPPTY